MENPFEEIINKLDRIEKCLLEIKSTMKSNPEPPEE